MGLRVPEDVQAIGGLKMLNTGRQLVSSIYTREPSRQRQMWIVWTGAEMASKVDNIIHFRLRLLAGGLIFPLKVEMERRKKVPRRIRNGI